MTLRKKISRFLDRGKPQVIAEFLVEKREVRRNTPQSAETGAAPQAAVLPKRITLYLFDDLHLSPADLAYLKKIDAQAMDGALTGSDMAAVASTSGKGQQWHHARSAQHCTTRS